MKKMTIDEFKTETRLTRGKLSKLDEELEQIYKHGIVELRELCYKNKQMGIANIAEIAYLDVSNQHDFHKWLMSKGFKAEKNEIELKYDSYFR